MEQWQAIHGEKFMANACQTRAVMAPGHGIVFNFLGG
jgi:hypothetical protein